jgi:hypothetical protein
MHSFETPSKILEQGLPYYSLKGGGLGRKKTSATSPPLLLRIH